MQSADLVALYRDMRRMRSFDARARGLRAQAGSADAAAETQLDGDAWSEAGQEAAAGLMRALGADDGFTTHDRGLGLFLARGADPARMFAELAGRGAGYCGGKGGASAMADVGLGHMGGNAVSGAGVPHAVGAALAFRNRREPRVAAAVFDDEGLTQGIVHESLSLAKLWRLPCLFARVGEAGVGDESDKDGTGVLARVSAIGLEVERADGSDAEAVHAAADRLLSGARVGRPGFLDIRPGRPVAGGADGDASVDPLSLTRSVLIARGAAGEEAIDLIDAQAETEMTAALEAALVEAPPSPNALLVDVFAPGEAAPDPVTSRLDRLFAEAAA